MDASRRAVRHLPRATVADVQAVVKHARPSAAHTRAWRAAATRTSVLDDALVHETSG